MCVRTICRSNIRVLTKLNVTKSEGIICINFHKQSLDLFPRKLSVDFASLRTRLTISQDLQAPVISDRRKRNVIEFLSTVGLRTNVAREEFKWIFGIDKDLLEEKFKLIKLMNFEKVEHSIPFYKLPTKNLLIIWKCVQLDERNNFCKNRLYYLSTKLQCDPAMLSVTLSKRTFIYTLSFDWIEKSLNVLLEMGVPPERIVKDLWVIKYNDETIRRRLESVKASGRDDLAPWMVRCSEQILQRSIQISQAAKNILGENSSVHCYLAERLNTTPEVVSVMCSKIPAIQTMRVTKAKSCLDFVFAEGFTERDVINVPRILAHSVKTIQFRLDKLRAVGVHTNNLNILCKSRKQFKKYYESLTGPALGGMQKMNCNEMETRVMLGTRSKIKEK